MVSKPKDKQEVMAIIISILLAFLLWIYVMGEKNPMQNKFIPNVPVALTNVESIKQANLALIPNQKFTVDLNISGRALDIFNISSSDFRVEADMSGYLKKGENNIPVEIKSPPKGISIVNKNGFPYIKVKLDSLVEKSVPVLINVRGNVKDGFGYTKPLVRPTEVMVSGAATYVDRIFAVIGQVDISGNYSSIAGPYLVKPEDKDGNIISDVNVNPKYVDVTVAIKPSKEVPIRVNIIGAVKDGKVLKSIKPQLDRIYIIGDKKYLDRVSQIETTPVDLSKIGSTTTREVFLNIPAGVKIVGDINSINVDFNVENKIERTMSLPINLMNQASDYNYGLSNDNASVTFVGPESVVDTINSDNINATVDVTGLTEGTHNLPVTVTQVDGTEIKTYSPDRITVNIFKK